MNTNFSSPFQNESRSTTVASFLLAVVVSCAAPVTDAQVLPADAQPRCAIAPAVITSWFETAPITVNGVVKPANSVTFPDQPNCSFYAWSEQMFLWLNSPTPVTYGGGGGRIFDSPAFFDVSPPDQNGVRTFIPHQAGGFKLLNVRSAQVGPNRLPIIFDKTGHMLEIQRPQFGPNGSRAIRDRSGKMIEIGRIKLGENRKPLFFDKIGKQIRPRFESQRALARKAGSRPVPSAQKFLIGGMEIFLDRFGNVVEVEQGQAGGNSVLLTQQGSLVYYGTHVNDVFAYFATGTKDGEITPMPTKFPTIQAELDKVTAFAQLHGKIFPDPEALAIEAKTAWVEANGLDTSKYVTMTATIPTYDMSDPAHMTWTPNGQKTTLLAMVGMHVVGSTKGHPEMIWATFEHFGNSPNAAYSYVNANNQIVPIPQDTSGNWLFSTSNSAGPFNVEHMHFASPNIVGTPPQNIGTSDTIRWKAWGAASDHAPNPLVSTAASNSEIISSNQSVLSQLLPGDVRSNYVMTGATWTIFGAPPNANNQVGTSKMANTTMETYQQGTNTLNATGSNCFSCHTSNTVSVSHVFDALTPLTLDGTLTIQEVVVPASNTGKFNVLVDGVVKSSSLGNGQSSGALKLRPGNHTITETGATGTILSKYAHQFGGACDSQGIVSLLAGDNKICIITNTKQPPSPACLADCQDRLDNCLDLVETPPRGGLTKPRCQNQFNLCKSRC